MSGSTKFRKTSSEGDVAFVRWLARWALLTAVLIVLFDLAVFRNYPLFGLPDWFRGLFYTIAGIVLLAATIGFAFLGYRIITTGYRARSRDLYLLFLPPVVLVTSLVWMLLLAASG